MKKVKFNNPSIKNKKDLEKNKSEIVDELLAKPFIKEKIEQLNIGMDTFNEYLGYFVSYADDYEACLYCKGLQQCPKEIKGIEMGLVLDDDDFLVRTFKLCKWKELERQINQNYIIRDFNDEHLNVELDSLDGRKGRTMLEKKLFEIDLDICKEGIYVHGDNDLGKSFSLIALCNGFVRRNIKCAFVDVKEFIERLKGTFGSYQDAYTNLMDSIKNVEVLVLDDLGEEKASEWVRDEILSTILDYRHKNKLLTFITSCYTLEELESLYVISKGEGNQKIRTKKFIDKIKRNCPNIIHVR